MINDSPRRTEWGRRWPNCSIDLLATLQLLLTLAIPGLEITSAIADVYHSMSFAGFYCPIFFMITWISMYSVSCCCCCRYRASICCSAHALVENILSIAAAIVLLVFNIIFLNDPYTCLYGFTGCSRSDYLRSYNSRYDSSYGIVNPTSYVVKLACIKAELACAVVMLVSNLVYVSIFIVMALMTRNSSNQNSQSQYGVRSPPGFGPAIAHTPYPAPQANYPMQVVSSPIPQPIPPSIESASGAGKPIDPPPYMAPPMPNQPLVPPLPQPNNLSQYESSWRSKFPKIPCLILSIAQLVLTVLIFIMEIASLGVAVGLRPTGVGIWCAIPFTIASSLTLSLVRAKGGSRMWATIALVAQLVLLVFTFILIGIAGNYVQNEGYLYSDYSSGRSSYSNRSPTAYNTKYQITQAQLAFGILMMFSGFFYVGMYMLVTLIALWLPHRTLDLPYLLRERSPERSLSGI